MWFPCFSLNFKKRHCNACQCVAVCCSVLQCVADCCFWWCNVFFLKDIAMRVSVLQCVAACCSVLQCVVFDDAVSFLKKTLQCVSADDTCLWSLHTYTRVLQCVAACCSVLQRVAVCCSVLHAGRMGSYQPMLRRVPRRQEPLTPATARLLGPFWGSSTIFDRKIYFLIPQLRHLRLLSHPVYDW